MMGHLIAAAGSVEAITCLLAIKHGVLPTINYETPDPDCDLDYVPNQAREHPSGTHSPTALGLEGQNITLIFTGYQG